EGSTLLQIFSTRRETVNRLPACLSISGMNGIASSEAFSSRVARISAAERTSTTSPGFSGRLPFASDISPDPLPMMRATPSERNSRGFRGSPTPTPLARHYVHLVSALYRKYRPQGFDEVVGQEAI